MPPQTLEEVMRASGAIDMPPPSSLTEASSDPLAALMQANGSIAAPDLAASPAAPPSRARVAWDELRRTGPWAGLGTLGRAAQDAVQVFGSAGTGNVPAMQSGLRDLKAIGGGVLASQNKVKAEADEAWKRGDKTTAVRKYLNWLMPLIGPAADEQANNLAEGQYAKAAGGLTGLALNVAGPEMAGRALAKVPSLPVVPRLLSRTHNPVESAGVALGSREGVPMDLATVTGRPAIRNMQKRLEGTIGGAAPTEAFQAAKDAGLTRTGRQFAQQVSPRATTPAKAGAGLRTAVERRITALRQQANTAYGRVDALEQANPTPVDWQAFQDQMRPLYEDLLQEHQLVPLQGGRGQMLVALSRVMQAPNTVSLSVAERALGDLKALSRGTGAPLKTGAQGLAAKAVGELSDQVEQAARGSHPDLYAALQEGRAATAEKWRVADTLDELGAKDVSAFQKVTRADDVEQALLAQVRTMSPSAAKAVGRAWLEKKLNLATREGKFQHVDRVYGDWQKLGPETKQALFGKAMTQQLDDFFKLAKDLGKNPNPSGTANVLAMNATQAVLYLPSKALAKIVYNPTAIKLLTEGLRMRGATGARLVRQAATVAGVSALATDKAE